jgi:uncharacterized membrane protein YidH (DUF202 family)
MKSSQILGIVLILIGAAILAYGHFSYRTRETVLEVGPIKATAEKTHSVPVPPILGWGLIVGGAVTLVFSGRSKT